MRGLARRASGACAARGNVLSLTILNDFIWAICAARWLLCVLLTPALLCQLARAQGEVGTDIWRRGICYTVEDAKACTLCIRGDRQRVDSLRTQRSLLVPERIILNSREYVVRSLHGQGVFETGQGLRFDTIRIPATVTVFERQCLGGVGPVGLLELPEGFDVNLLSKSQILRGTYPRRLAIRGELTKGFAWRRGGIYSADFEVLHYYARQEADTVLYVPTHVRVVKRGALDSWTARHLVLGRAMELEDVLTDEVTVNGLQSMTYYDPFLRLVGNAAVKGDRYTLRRPGRFCLTKDHAGRRRISTSRLVPVDKIPPRSSFTLHVRGKGKVWIAPNAMSTPRLAADGEQFTVDFSSVVRCKLEPDAGQRIIGLAVHGDSIRDAEVMVPICFENESITAIFAGVDELVNGVDYQVSAAGDTVVWLRFLEPITDLRDAPHLRKARHYAAGRSHNASVLEGLILPEGVNSLGRQAFKGCNRLRALAIPGGLERVEPGAFSGLSSLRQLYIGGLPPANMGRLLAEFAPLPQADKPLCVYVDATHLEAWSPLSELRHVSLQPVGASVRIENAVPNEGSLRVRCGGLEFELDAAQPSRDVPHLSHCMMDYRLPMGYDLESIECNGETHTVQPVRCLALGDVRVSLKSKRVYCPIEEPHAVGGMVLFERQDGHPLQPGDSVMRGEVVRVQALPGEFSTFEAMSVNGHVTTTADTLVTVLRALGVSVTFRPQLCAIHLSDTAHFRWVVEPPVSPGGTLPKGTDCRIAAVPRAGYELARFAVNGQLVPSPWHGRLMSDMHVEASAQPAGVRIALEPSTEGRLSIVDALGNRIAQDAKLPLNSVIRFRYAVSPPEVEPELYINGLRAHLPPGEWHQHTLREDCRFDVRYDTLWRYVSIDPAVGKLLVVEADRIIVERPALVGVPDGSAVTFGVFPEQAYRVRHLLIDDQAYASASVTLTLNRNVRFGAELEQRAGRVLYTMKQPGGRVVVKDAQGRVVKPGAQKPRGFPLFITPLPAKGHVVGMLSVNRVAVMEPTAAVEMGDSVQILCEFVQRPCVLHGDHCIDEERGVLVSSQFAGQELVLDDPAVRIIGPSAFADNQSLRRVSLGETVERVEAGAFHGCGELRVVYVPTSVAWIGPEAFTGCAALHVLDLERTSPTGFRMDAGALDADLEDGTRLFAVRVPSGCQGAFARSKAFRAYPVAERQVSYEVKCKGAEGVPLLVRATSLVEGTVTERVYTAPTTIEVEGGAVVRIEAMRSASWRIEQAKWNGEAVALPMEQMALKSGVLQLVVKANPGGKGKDTKADGSSDFTASVYPNPVSGTLYVPIESDMRYEIYTLTGLVVLHGWLHGPLGQVDVAHLPAGTYLLWLAGERLQGSIRFVKH